MEREKLQSRLGFILLSAGCAIGIGNVWKFPYMAGKGGGGAFVLFYLIFLALLGLPVLCMEFSVGRASQKSPLYSFRTLEKPGQFWHIHGYVSLAANYLLMMFYTTVAGWMLHYFYLMVTGHFTGADPEFVGSTFDHMLAQPATLFFWMVVVVSIGIFVCMRGLADSLEKVTKFMMIALLFIMVILAVNSFFMDGAKEGLSFYLVPDFNRMAETGIANTLVGAMNQAFFTLSLGMGSMAIFGSYLDKSHSLLGESINVAILDTFVALTAGLIIFPACFTYDVEVGAGPSLIFETLPNVFNHMSMGTLWGSLFFVFMTFAAMSTVFAVFENILACCMDLFGWSRKKSCAINCVALVVLSMPCALGFNLLSGIHPMGGGSNFLDLEDFLVSNILLPLGSVCYILFATSKLGWGWKNYMAEANTGKGLKVQNWMRGYITYVLPVIMLFIFVFGMISYFK